MTAYQWHRLGRFAIAATFAVLFTACDPAGVGTVDGKLAVGTWGGNNAGLILDDTLAHIHIGCTYGDFPAPVMVDGSGRISVAGSYLLRAYPVAVGPTMPAHLSGTLDGTTLTFSITVTDTIEHKDTIMGPATVVLGKEPSTGPCPICKTPGDRARARLRALNSVKRRR